MPSSPDIAAALSADAFGAFTAVEIATTGSTLRLLDGEGVLTFSAMTFTGGDENGFLADLGSVADGIEEDAPSLTITLGVADADAAIDLIDPDMQGKQVRVWEGCYDRATGLVIPDPELKFIGAVDVPSLKRTADGRFVELECGAYWDGLLQPDDAARLNNAWHQSVFPGELGLEFVDTMLLKQPAGPVYGTFAGGPAKGSRNNVVAP